jgi:hypothetical protein
VLASTAKSRRSTHHSIKYSCDGGESLVDSALAIYGRRISYASGREIDRGLPKKIKKFDWIGLLGAVPDGTDSN